MKRKAFTLIEVVVSVSASVAILAVATGIVAGSMRDARRARVRAQLARDSQLIDRQLRTELPQIGLGVPTARHIDSSYGSGGGTFYASVLVAGPEQLGFLADLPRPDAQLSPFGILTSRPLGGRDRINWLNDSTGSCLPDTGAGSCSRSDDSYLFPNDGSTCTSDAADRVCPWSMKRLVPGEPFQIVAGDGSWTHAYFPLTPALVNSAPPAGMQPIPALQLSAPWGASWPNTAAGEAPGGLRGQGYVTTIDRVFYTHDVANHVLRRVQCWGDPDPFRDEWPGPTKTQVPPVSDLRFGVIPGADPTKTQTCTPPEVVARAVKSVSFHYFDVFDGEVVNANSAVLKGSIRRIDYDIVLEREHDGQKLQEQLTGSVAIRN